MRVCISFMESWLEVGDFVDLGWSFRVELLWAIPPLARRGCQAAHTTTFEKTARCNFKIWLSPFSSLNCLWKQSNYQNMDLHCYCVVHSAFGHWGVCYDKNQQLKVAFKSTATSQALLILVEDLRLICLSMNTYCYQHVPKASTSCKWLHPNCCIRPMSTNCWRFGLFT